MIVIIFKAELADIDETYSSMVMQLREEVDKNPGFVSMDSVCEDGVEITLSYWRDEESIRQWHQHPLHQKAQYLGKERWYKSYSVEKAIITEE